MDWIIFAYYARWLIFCLLFLFILFFAKSKSAGKKIGASVLIALSFIFIYAGFIEPKLLAVHANTVFLRQRPANDFRAVVVSDLHIGIFKNGVNLERVVDKINSLDPDVVFMAGDFVFRLDKDKIDEALAGLAEIKAPVYAVTGNHDEGKPGKNVNKEVIAALKKYGIHAVDDEIETAEISQSKLEIIGLSDYWTGDADFGLLSKFDHNKPSIVLTHNPDIVYHLPDKTAVDLVISGHTHGGQIRLPLLYKFAIPSEYDFDRGFYKINGINVFVSSGIGMVGLPLRFLVPPEIDVLEIQ